MLTQRQHDLISFLEKRLENTGVCPTFREMAEALDLASISGIHRILDGLEERGYIRRLPNRARAIEIVKKPANTPV